MSSKIMLNEELLKFAVMGGAILGGGGGGCREEGLNLGKAALKHGKIFLQDIECIPEETLIVTASLVGSPASKEGKLTLDDYIKTVKLLEERIGEKFGGVITNEQGGNATVNGWIQSAALNIPLIDAPCNGRAHPTGTMGSIGLNTIKGYVSHQAAVGGDPALDNYVEMVVSGSLNNSAKLVRQVAVANGGLTSVARNPVKASYLKKNAAIGGVNHAIETGRSFYKGLETHANSAIENVVKFLKGEIVVKGKVTDYSLETQGGFDVGFVSLDNYELVFWNEYMTLEKNGERIFTFPDLIMTMDCLTGMPVTTAEIKAGMNVAVIATDRKNLKLGSGMFQPELLKEVEPIINREIVKYVI